MRSVEILIILYIIKFETLIGHALPRESRVIANDTLLRHLRVKAAFKTVLPNNLHWHKLIIPYFYQFL